MKILVTGSNGFIGKNLIKKLRILNYEVYPVERKDGNISLDSVWNQFPVVDIVIHLASKTIVTDSWLSPVDYLETNIMGTINALDYCRKHKAKLIYISTSLYSDHFIGQISETDTIISKHPYGLSKKVSEDICKFYQDNFKIDVIILRLFNVYGPNQNSSYLIPTIIKQVVENKIIQIRDLRPKRDFIYIDDVINAIIIALRKEHNSGVFNIGSGKSLSVEELIQSIQNVACTSLKVESLNIERSGEVMDSCANITLAEQELGWFPKFDLKMGISLIISSLK